MKMAFVNWDDSSTTRGWHGPDKDGPVCISSVGWLVYESESFIVLSSSRGTSGNFLDQISIPKSAIRKIKRMNMEIK